MDLRPPPADVPFGFTFSIDDDGGPQAVGPHGPGHFDTLADHVSRWCADRDDALEQLAVIDDVLGGGPARYLWYDDTRIDLDASSFAVSWTLRGFADDPVMTGPTTELRRLLVAWIAWVDRSGGWSPD